MSKYLPLPLKGPGVPPGVPQGQILDLYSNFAENFTRANYSKVSIKLKSCYMHTLPTKRQGRMEATQEGPHGCKRQSFKTILCTFTVSLPMLWNNLFS